jgi:hypothetical protein
VEGTGVFGGTRASGEAARGREEAGGSGREGARHKRWRWGHGVVMNLPLMCSWVCCWGPCAAKRPALQVLTRRGAAGCDRG